MYFIKILIITIFFGREAAVIFHDYYKFYFHDYYKFYFVREDNPEQQTNVLELPLPPSVAVFLCLYEKTAHPSRADGRTKNTK